MRSGRRHVRARRSWHSGTRDLGSGTDAPGPFRDRPLAAIGRSVLGIVPPDAAAFYRAWTFYEAYFKAFQQYPDVHLIDSVCGCTKEGAAVRLAPDTFLEQRCVTDAFRMCLVWTANEDATMPNNHYCEYSPDQV